MFNVCKINGTIRVVIIVQAGMFEAMNNVYKVMIPITEANRDYRKLAYIHG